MISLPAGEAYFEPHVQGMRIVAEDLRAFLLEEYQEGGVAALLYGDSLLRRLIPLLIRYSRGFACQEIGSSLALRQLKRWLGGRLEPDWESRLFERDVQCPTR